MTVSLLLAAALPVFLIMAAGALLRRWQVLTPEGDGSLISLAVNVTYPCFILHGVVGNPALQHPENVWLPLLCGAGFMIAGGALTWLLAPIFGLRQGSARRTFSLACSVQNYGYLPIPVLAAIFPDKGWMGVLFVYSLGIELVMWTLGVWLMDPQARGGASRRALNPVVLSIVLGLALNGLPWGAWLPADGPMPWPLAAIVSAGYMLGECAIPLGLLVVGATLHDLMSRPGWAADWKTAAGGVIMRLAVLPCLMLVLLALLPASVEFRRVIAVQAAMPAAVFPLIVARRYGGDEATAMRVIVITTLVSLVTIPFAVRVALDWAGVGP